ncbi:MAG: hypothetical protein P4L27_07935 [Ignavibacteriaceae bacterium]|nr:hypothetical protein [Ignavibacteriaceae bacterium]
MTQNTDHVEINDDCISCAACVPMCQWFAISQGNGKYVVDTIKCNLSLCLSTYGSNDFCKLPCVSVCPVSAIQRA